MKQAIFLCGLPGSGKSSYVKHKIPDNFAIISEDIFLEHWAEEKGISYVESFQNYADEASQKMMDRLEDVIDENQDLCWDQVNLTKQERKENLAMVGNDYEKIIVCWELDLSILEDHLNGREMKTGKHIPPDVIEEMRASYERPDYDEGWDSIQVIKSWMVDKPQ